MIDPAPVQRWKASNDLIWTQYDDGDEWVVYDPASGDVHLLTSSARVLWSLISKKSPQLNEDLAGALACELARSPDEQLMSMIQETLSAMDRAGLIRPIPWRESGLRPPRR
jgi:PqqD family protein of HPr-rel-A system